MVAEVLADSGQVVDDFHSHVRQMVGGPDPREHEDVGRSDGTRAEDDLLALDGEGLSPAFDDHTCGPAVGDDDPVDEAVGADCEIQAVAGHAQVAEVCAPSNAVRVVHRDRSDADGVRVVVVWAVGETGRTGSLRRRRTGMGATRFA